MDFSIKLFFQMEDRLLLKELMQLEESIATVEILKQSLKLYANSAMATWLICWAIVRRWGKGFLCMNSCLMELFTIIFMEISLLSVGH